METIRTSETSASFCDTARRSISEDSHLHNRPQENLKSHRPHDWHGQMIVIKSTKA